MSDYPKFLRILMEFEVEITDPVAAKAFTFDVTSDADGEIDGFLNWDPEQHIVHVVSRVFSEAMVNAADQIGIKWLSGSHFARYVTEEGYYGEEVLPAMPRRNDDGELIYPPDMEPLE